MHRLALGEGVGRSVFDPARTGLSLGFLGLAVWICLSIFAGLMLEDEFRLHEAWDAAAYFYVGVPIMALSVGLAGFHHPERAWRWPLWLVGGHQAGMLLLGLGMQSGVSLIILALALGTILGVLFTVPALLGAAAARRLHERAY